MDCQYPSALVYITVYYAPIQSDSHNVLIKYIYIYIYIYVCIYIYVYHISISIDVYKYTYV